MNYFIFKVGVKNDNEVKTYSIIENSDLEYILYDNYLKSKYFTDIKENDDYIPLTTKNESVLILRDDQFKQTEIEDVFEILCDSLYMDWGEEYEKSVNY